MLRGNGCPKCAGCLKKTNEQFVEELIAVNPTITVLDKYQGSRTPISVSCNRCGTIWKAAPTNLLKGQGCPFCSYKSRGLKRRKTSDEFYSEMLVINPEIELLEPYISSNHKIRVKCKICSNEWMVTPASLLHGNGCPRCAHTGTSYVEQIILLTLQKLCPFPVLSRDRTAIGMELDIYIPTLHYAIEYGAWPWHADKTIRDNEKVQLCKEHGITLIEIFDAYDGNEKETVQKWLYRENIGRKGKEEEIKGIVVRICDTIGIPFSLSDEGFTIIQAEARQNARTLTTEKLNELLVAIGSDVFVTGDYKDALSKVLVECKTCGHRWEVIPASLLRGYGCPVCAINRRSEKLRKTTEQFIAEIKEINPDIEVIGEYKGNHSGIEVRCKKHNVRWFSSPSSLLRGAGCPECRREKISQKQRKTTAEFLEEVHRANNSIEVLDTYVNQKTKIRARCNRCKTEFCTWPDTLLRGGGCPTCARTEQAQKRRKTKDAFSDEVSSINPGIILLGTYTNSHNKILVRCKKCGHEWEAVASSILQGYGCPFCAGNKKKTHSDFVRELREKKPMIEVKGDYVHAKAKIKVCCKNCGYEWDSTPTGLLNPNRQNYCKNCEVCFNEREINHHEE